MSTEAEEAAAIEQAAIDKRSAAVEASMTAAGVKTSELIQEDYFAFDVQLAHTMPDGISKVLHKALNEGQRKLYLKKTNRDIRIKKSSGDAEMRMASGEEKYALLELAIIGWDFKSGGQPVPYSKQNLIRFLDNANPVVIDDIHKAITKANPWLLMEMSSEDIRTEITNLEEMLEAKIKEEEGKAAS